MPLKKTTTKPDATDALVGSDMPGFTGGIDPKMGITTEMTDVIIHTPVVAKIISLCDFSDDSVMVKFIKQKQWEKLFQVTNIKVDDIKDFHTVKNDGISLDEKPLMTHLRMLKCLLVYYKRKCHENDSVMSEDDVLNIRNDQFHSYCGSDDYFIDLAAWLEESSTQQVVDTPNTTILDIVNVPKLIPTEDVHGNSDDYEENSKENGSVNSFVVETYRTDVINDDA
jgi:hypothetical protein